MFGKKNKPFFIAEISSNHNGKIENAINLIKQAKLYGADAVKLQTYKPSTMTIKSKKKFFKIKKGLWKGYSLWSLYKKAHTPYEWHGKLFKLANKIGIKIFSTPFDESAVDLLEKLNCPFYKIASFEMTDIPLIKKVAQTKKPMIISTGMANLEEIEYSYNKAKEYGAKKIVLLYCVSNYPSKINDFNLNNIKILKKKFNCEVGFSDHSIDNKIAISAVSAGATVVEKHIGLKNVKALDFDFSISGKNISDFKNDINNLQKISKQDLLYKKLLGKVKFFRNKSEDKSKIFRRSIFIVKNIKKGGIINEQNTRIIRPGFGISPIYYEDIIGKKTKFKLEKGEPLTKSLIRKIGVKTYEKKH
tara:strand:+ start:359 stop:1438 length:1080 start_codon:yes stop_codon:yes gene_type:complete